MKRVTEFLEAHESGTPISMVTCYDAWSASIIAKTTLDAVLVGDSVAMVMHGFPDTVHATVQMMELHTAAVRRGLGPDKVIVADIPFAEHRKGCRAAMECVERLMRAGANAVKIEGARGHLDVVSHIVESGVPVLGHLGLTPQSVHLFGGHRLQGTDARAAEQLQNDALDLQKAGVFGIVLECIPSELARRVSDLLLIPTIGIGSGLHCGGQVLVLHDLLGLTPDFRPRFLRTYLEGAASVEGALEAFNTDVKSRKYPNEKECWNVPIEEC